MKIRLLLMCLTAVLFTACGTTVNYLGKSYAPTSQLDLYFDRIDILRDYEIMGRAEVSIDIYTPTLQRAQEGLEKYAREKGADAIIFESIHVTTPPSLVTTENRKKNEDGSYTVVSTTSTKDDQTKIVKATFIKYK